jgi:non-ribosomal peptide synthetase component F
MLLNLQSQQLQQLTAETAVVQVLLGRYSRSEDIVVGTPLANRTRPELEGLIGYFVNSAALRVDLAGAHAHRGYLAAQKFLGSCWQPGSNSAACSR